jgi:hypothetical protein
VDELIIVAVIVGLLLWIAAVAYLIYKDHGVIEHIDGLFYKDYIPVIDSKNKGKIGHRKRFNKRLKI